MRLYAGIHPVGATFADPCEVVCSQCGVLEVARNLVEAQAVAWRHDLEHDAATRADLEAGRVSRDKPAPAV
jgi:hypothetical protein